VIKGVEKEKGRSEWGKARVKKGMGKGEGRKERLKKRLDYRMRKVKGQEIKKTGMARRE
jgi:hypothetical protein